MGKAADLSDFDRGQIVMSISLLTSYAYLWLVFPTGTGIFQQDNVPCHRAGIVLQGIEEHDELQLISWPPNSSYINPIEHTWDLWGASSELTNHIQVIYRSCVTCAYKPGPISLKALSKAF